MKIKVKKSILEGEIQCPPSKSYTHRALVISSLAAGKSNLNNILVSRDTYATLNCCRMLGVNIMDKRYDALSHNHKNVIVTSEGGSCGFMTPNDVLQSDNSGTTIRLLTSACALVSEGYSVLTGDDSLRRRPMGDLIKALNQLGVTCFSTNSNYFPPVIVKGGGIEGGVTQISGQISSQFISSLLLSSIFSKKGTTIQVLGNQVSKPYIESTIHIMKYFGVDILNEIKYSISENSAEAITEMASPKIANVVTEEYIVPPNFVYKAKDFDIPGDFSTASLLMAAAILTKGNLKIKGLNFDMPQGDMAIIDILRKMGGQVTIDRLKGSLIVEGNSKLQGGIFDLRKTPDLLPVLAILSLVAEDETHIHGISHARYKETDRVTNIASQLRRFGASIIEKEDSIIIKPPKQIRGTSIESFKDHRLFMAFTIAGLATENSSVEGAESVDVSYPQFISDLRMVGADIQIVGTS